MPFGNIKKSTLNCVIATTLIVAITSSYSWYSRHIKLMSILKIKAKNSCMIQMTLHPTFCSFVLNTKKAILLRLSLKRDNKYLVKI